MNTNAKHGKSGRNLTDKEAREEMDRIHKASWLGNIIISTLFAVAALLACCVPLLAKAEVKELTVDSAHHGTIFICKTVEDANDVSTTEVGLGLEEASKVFEEKFKEGKCLGTYAIFIPKKLVSTAKGKTTVYVVEVEVNGNLYYMLSEYPIKRKGTNV